MFLLHVSFRSSYRSALTLPTPPASQQPAQQTHFQAARSVARMGKSKDRPRDDRQLNLDFQPNNIYPRLYSTIRIFQPRQPATHTRTSATFDLSFGAATLIHVLAYSDLLHYCVFLCASAHA